MEVALNEAVAVAGGQAALARAIGVSQPSVWHWVNKSRKVAAEYVLKVEAATGVHRRRLRPDLYPLTIDDGEPGTWKDAIAHSPNLRVEDYVPAAAGDQDRPGWGLTEAEIATLPERDADLAPVVICDVCEARLDRDLPKACTFVDCPHAVRNAA